MCKKQIYHDWDSANQALTALVRSGKAKDAKRVQVYRCDQHPGKFHVGHSGH